MPGGEEYFCRHNLKYWQRLPYLGLGPAAHSFQGGRRWWNHRGLPGYAAALAAGRAPRAGREILSPEQVRLETLYLGFRTREGVDLKVIQSQSGWDRVLSRLQAAGLLRLSNSRVAATPRGLVVADRLPLLFVDYAVWAPPPRLAHPTKKGVTAFNRNPLKSMVGTRGFEPRTPTASR